MDRTLTIVGFEPDWCALYVDGELYDDGHDYQEADILKDLLMDSIDIDEVEERHIHPDKWRGTPQTLSELKDTYDG